MYMSGSAAVTRDWASQFRTEKSTNIIGGCFCVVVPDEAEKGKTNGRCQLRTNAALHHAHEDNDKRQNDFLRRLSFFITK